jgi:hypothetical protein
VQFGPGTTVVLREVLDGRIRSARPLRVIHDDPQRFVGYLVPRSRVAWPRLVDTEQSQTPDQGWRLPLETWQGPGSLFVVPAGAGFAAVLFFDPGTGQPLSWKVDFMRPLRRRPTGFDTLDHAFDILAPLDTGRWEAKDLDDLAQLVRLGLLDGAERAAFEEERERVSRWLAHGGGPFGEGWGDWRPEPSWPPLDLPAGWDEVATEPTDRDPGGGPAGGLVLRGPGRRSGRGVRLLDGDGRVVLDLVLDGGAQWLGHACPAVIDAVRRQLPLGWSHGGDHPAARALARRLLAAAPAGWRLAWAPAGWRPAAGAAATLALDRALIHHGWPLDVAGHCAEAGAEAVSLSSALFAGIGGCSVRLGPPGSPAVPDRAGEPDTLAAVAALEVLQQAGSGIVAATAARAGRIRRAVGLGGRGPELVGPAGWSAPGVLVPADGRGLLAAGADDVDEAELVTALAEWQR